MLATLLLAVLAAVPCQDPLAGVPVEKTKHFELILDMSGERRADWALLAEAAWQGSRDALGSKPRTKAGKRPIVRFYATREDWLAGMEREEVFPLPGERFVHFSSKRDTVFMHNEAHAYHARKMFLYGLFLQFHFHLKSKNQYLGKEWFITGMADALSTHRWDGKQLELGAELLLARENRAHIAKLRGVFDKIQDGELSVEDMSDWDVRWALTAFLMRGADGEYSKLFHKLALGKQGSMLLGTDFLAGIGDAGSITAQMDSWLRERQLAFEPQGGAWAQQGAGLIGAVELHEEYALAFAGEHTRVMEVVLTSQLDTGSGLIMAWKNSRNYTFVILRDGHASVLRMRSGALELLDDHDLPRSNRKPQRLRIEREGKQVLLLADERELGRYNEVEARFGLVVQEGTASFEQVRAE